MLNLEELEEKFPTINKVLFTVDLTDKMTLKDKISQYYIDCGIDEEEMNKFSIVEQYCTILIGLFGQAFELKSVSIILNCPLYITRHNVILYLNCISFIDDLDRKRIIECNILFSLYHVLKNVTKEDIKKDDRYNEIVELLSKEYSDIHQLVLKLKEIIKIN